MGYLHKMTAIIYEVDRGSRTTGEGARDLEVLGREALVDPEASQLANTMIGISFSRRQDESMAIGGLFGMVVGGFLGAAVGGQPGASIGALIGGFVGAWAVGLCEANE